MQRLSRFWPLLFLALLPILPLHHAVFDGEAIGPFDQIRQMAPWNGVTPSEPWDALQADSVLQFYPWRDMVFDAWRHHQMPLWNPYELAGTPLLANSQSGALYPPHILVGLSGMPTAAGITLLAWIHLFWAGLGVYAVARRLGGSRLSATLGGASFMLSAFALGWTPLPSVIETVSWIPWLLAAVLHGFPSPMVGHARVEARSKPLKAAAGLSLAVGMMLLAGHLQFCAYGLMASVFALLWMGVANLKSRPLAVPLGLLAIAVGGVLAAPQVVPVLDYGQFSHRRSSGTPSEENYQAYASGGLKSFELASLPSASLLGNPRAWDSTDQARAPAFWPQFAKPGANFADSAISVGPVVLTLLFLVPWRRKGVGLFGSIAAVALLLAVGSPLNRLLYFGVPGWSATGSVGRIGCLFVLSACCAIGVAAPVKGRTSITLPFALLPLIFFAGAIALLRSVAFPDVFVQFAFLVNDGIRSALPFLIAGYIAALLAVQGITSPARTWRFWALAAPILASLGFALNIICTGLPLEGVPSDANSRIAVANPKWPLFHAADTALLPPNLAALNRIHELGGYDSLMHRDSVAMLRQIDGADPAPPANGNMMLIKPGASREALGAAGVTELWQKAPNGSVEKTVIPGPGRASTPIGPATIEDESYVGVTVKCDGPGTLTLRDRNMPGWKASVDGRPAPIKDGLWREVELSAGRHTVAFRYEPRGISLWPESLALGIALLLCWAWPTRAQPETERT